MRVWAQKRIGVRGVQFIKGWQDVAEDAWNGIKDSNYTVNLLTDGLLRLEENGPAEAPRPPPASPSVPKMTELPSKAGDVADLIRACKTLDELEYLNTIGLEDDDRKSVTKAYNETVDRLQGD